MDGLSAAASGIAVVSLALQLVSSVRDIRRFLHSMSEAPEELKRLMDLLEQLEFVLEQVGLLAKRERGNTRLEGTSMMASVLRAITTCQKKLELLEGVVKATKDVKASSNRATRALGSFKLVCKKTDIRWIEQQLNEAVNLLSLTMMANLTHLHEEGVGQLHSQMCTTHHTTKTILQELVLLRSEILYKSGETFEETNFNIGCANEQAMSSKTRHRTSGEQSISTRQYTGLFGKLLIHTVIESAKSLDSKINSTLEACSTTATCWAIMPSFLPRCFEYQSMNSYGCIQRALRIYPVLPKRHPIWRMCSGGDLKGVQTLLETRQVSPFSVDANGVTLLHACILHPKIHSKF
ncbi:hypothetical protein NA56DRAFT_186417 [Hyaloscypha hepaticicola]|uniref:Fungal N-terminal domain-containing protein n=1 Tax=Hyaloscypha hepaticicola TaxID=2082293 RepID=A0A2J6Q1K6_9HELO|nr:hypothetical protein NA56DRAFT_186417 [Hyaloscypha hepaticicola]